MITVNEAPERPEICVVCEQRINMPYHSKTCCQVCEDSRWAAFQRSTERYEKAMGLSRRSR